jgi:hypothetical protein
MLRGSFSRKFIIPLALGTLALGSSRNVSSTNPMSFANCDASNALMEKSSLPKFRQIEPVHVIPAVTEDLSTMINNFKTLEKNIETGEPSYESVVEKMEEIQAPGVIFLGYCRTFNGSKKFT